MDGNKKFRSRAIIIKTALRFITKTRQKSSLIHEDISSESLSSSAPPSSATYSPSLSLDLYYHQQEKYQKRKLSISIRNLDVAFRQND